MDDTETGTFASALLATQIALRVSDGGSFAVNVVPSGCREGAGGSVRCVDGGRNVLLVAKRAGPLQYRLRVRVRNLSEAETGHLRPRGPVRVTIEQLETADRIDTVSDCFLPGVSMLLCRDLGRPNLIFLVSDDQRWDTMADMPRVQRLLIDHGINFTNAFVTTPLCCPSRASMLTGQYARHHGIRTNILPEGGAPKFVGVDASTLPTWLQAVGYRTGMYGKYLTGYSVQCPPFTPGCYVPPGWDEWHVFVNQRYYDYRLTDGRADTQFGSAPEDYSTDVLTAQAVEFITSSHGQPFFLHLGYHAPHSDGPGLPKPAPRHSGTIAVAPHWRPPSYDEEDITDKPPWFLDFPRSDFRPGGGIVSLGAWTDGMRRYMRESLLAVDESVEALVAALEATGQADDTVIVFTSDNGYLWGEHRNFSVKDYPYEESVRVPLIIRYPRLETAPRAEARFALNIDLAPTLADLAGATPTSPVDGVSLRPLLDGSAAEWRPDFLMEWWNFTGVGMPSYTALHAEQYKYCAYERPPVSERELYDLTADSYELDNRAADPAYAATAAALQARLQAYPP